MPVKTAAFTVLAIALTGCGGSSSHSASSASQPAATTSSASRSPAHHTSTSQVLTAAPAPPSGTPAAPDGLRQTTGYATYELCSGRCTGAVPSSLRRPLRIPATCQPGSSGGPVGPQGGASVSTPPFVSSAWRGGRVTWTASSSYRGPVLIRGRRVGGGGAIGFGEGHVPYDELQLLDSGQQAPPQPGGGRAWLTFTRVKSPGCYAYQVDGTSFSSVIVFRAS